MILQANSTAWIFPGQGSQTVGMGLELAQTYPVARAIFEQADQILGFPLSQLAWEGPETTLNETIHTQPALLVHSVAALRVLQEQFPDFEPALVAGHSMGELSALVAAGALDFEPALKLVRRRGELMQEAGQASPGGMAAVLGLEIARVDEICHQASRANEIVQVANDNCPGQVVISGAQSALERAMELASQAGARKVVRLAVSIAAHSPLMAHAQAGFNQAVSAAALRDPRIAIIGNVTATALRTAAEIESDLQAQLGARVRWTETIQHMLAAGITTLVEIGNGDVLTGLVKRIERSTQRISFGSPADLEKLRAI